MTKSCLQCENYFQALDSFTSGWRLTTKRPASCRPFLVWIRKPVSIFGGGRTASAEPVVHPDLDGVFVVPEAPPGDIGGASGEGGLAEIIILVLGPGRPVGREHVFETGADGVAVLVAAIGGEAGRNAGHGDADIVAVPPGVAALGVKQRRPPGVAKPTGHRTELVGVGGHQRT